MAKIMYQFIYNKDCLIIISNNHRKFQLIQLSILPKIIYFYLVLKIQESNALTNMYVFQPRLKNYRLQSSRESHKVSFC